MSDKYGRRRRPKGALRRRLQIAGAAILLAGLAGAAAVYGTAVDGPQRDAGYEMAGGQVYPVSPEDSKTYIHDMEVFGGKSAVVSDAFRRWFAGLWHGKSLAFTVACSAVFISAGFFLAGARLPLLLRDEGADKDPPEGAND
ncbi:MAG: hypothetical protein M0Z60_05190 [Nitrospiraceae bacterium]|nr:hypothetical protein [Nitrospiraceae bacterium]